MRYSYLLLWKRWRKSVVYNIDSDSSSSVSSYSTDSDYDGCEALLYTTEVSLNPSPPEDVLQKRLDARPVLKLANDHFFPDLNLTEHEKIYMFPSRPFLMQKHKRVISLFPTKVFLSNTPNNGFAILDYPVNTPGMETKIYYLNDRCIGEILYKYRVSFAARKPVYFSLSN